jgi:hypothetical protein
MGVPLNLPETLPKDAFETTKDLKDIKINPPDTKEYKEYFEVKLGGGHPNNGLTKYISNDRKVNLFFLIFFKVLSFDAYWHD